MLRIGVVAFTNTLPLASGLDELLPQAQIAAAAPAAIARDLAAGRLDLGVVPVAAVAVHPEWEVVEGLGIAVDGPARAGLLLSKVPCGRIRRVVADPASRTSNILARLWLAGRHGIRPEVVSGTGPIEARLRDGDAVVAIGDEALFWGGRVPERVDLGGAWRALTGLPFVFAVWAGPGAATPGLAAALHACYDRNERRLGELAARAAGEDTARCAVLESYLRHTMRHRIGERERLGLGRFLTLARDAGLLEPDAAEVSHGEPR